MSTGSSVCPLFCFLQMDSEGEEQTLKACNSSTGEHSLPFITF